MANAIKRIQSRKRSGSPRIVNKSQWYKGRSDPYYGVNGKFKGGEVITRYFTSLLAASTQSWSTDQITLTGDFKITATCVAIGGARQPMLGHPTNADSVIAVRTSLMKGFINFTNIGVAGTYDLKDDEFVDWEFERSGTTFTWKQDGVTLATSLSVPTDTYNIFSIGKVGNQFGTGIYSDVKIYDAGVLAHSWAIDEADPSTIVDSVGGKNGTGINITTADADLYQFVGGTWVAV